MRVARYPNQGEIEFVRERAGLAEGHNREATNAP